MAEQQRQRGYLSTVDPRLHFGLGARNQVDSLLVTWPDGSRTKLAGVNIDQELVIAHEISTAPASAPPSYFPSAPAVLRPFAGEWLPEHQESNYTDFDRYALQLRDNSHDGPALAATKTGLLIFGGAAGQPVAVYDAGGGAQVQELNETQASEATRLLLFDYDGDGDEDLYVGNGSSEFAGREQYYQDLLYRNDAGVFKLVDDVLPPLGLPVGALAAADLEGDGDLDLFVGARQVSGRYPLPPSSFILLNEGGRFTISDELEAGMVTGAIWDDLDGDGRPDLATVGEYTSLRIFLNKADGWLEQPADPNLSGWWYSLTPNDLDGDGDVDLLAGNFGLNSLYTASPDRPLTVRADDYDGNGTIDPILTAYIGDAIHPIHPRNTLARQLPVLKRQFPDYATYGKFTDAQMPVMSEKGLELVAREFRSAWFENNGNGAFTAHFLPAAGQTAPLRAAVATTLPDGRRGLLVVQNDHATEVLGGRMDAGTGFALTLDVSGEPRVMPEFWSVRGDARSVVRLDSMIFVGINGGEIRGYR